MSNIHTLTQLEDLPNEMLFEYFKYLPELDLFYSFDQLNYRFNNLIRAIPLLYLNFESVRKSMFDQFCLKMKFNPEIKTQILSLKLSDVNTLHQIKIFLSFFSLNEFSHLKSLTLTNISKNNMVLLTSMLPLLSELHSFHEIRSFDAVDNLLVALPVSKLKVLSITTLQPFFTLNDKIFLVTTLTVGAGSLIELSQILKYVPMLKYLHVQNVHRLPLFRANVQNADNYYAVHLKQLVFRNFKSEFEKLEIFLKQIPNLRDLTISADDIKDIINAGRWKDLIRSSLPLLKFFKFKFSCYYSTEYTNIVKKFKEFQSSFWQNEHHWYTEYVLNTDSAAIYTVPYTLKTYELKSNSKGYSNQLMSDLNKFSNVTDLILSDQTIKEKRDYYFSNVTSLTINYQQMGPNSKHLLLKEEDIEFLKSTINLSNLKHLSLSSSYRIASSESLLEMFKEAPQLSSMNIDLSALIPFFNDDKLCECFNKMIKKLDLYVTSYYSFNNSHELTKFCMIFSNLEQLICKIGQPDSLFYILNHLSKLSILRVYMESLHDAKLCSSRLQNEAKKRNMIFQIEHNLPAEHIVQIWTG